MAIVPRSFRWACNSVNRSTSPARSSSGTDVASHARNTRTASTTRYLGVSHGLLAKLAHRQNTFRTACLLHRRTLDRTWKARSNSATCERALNPGSVEWATLCTPRRSSRAGCDLDSGPDVRACQWGEELVPSSPASQDRAGTPASADRATAGARRLTSRRTGPWSWIAPPGRDLVRFRWRA